MNSGIGVNSQEKFHSVLTMEYLEYLPLFLEEMYDQSHIKKEETSGRHRQNRPNSFLTKKSDYDAKSAPYSAYDFNISKLPLNIRCREEILVKLSQTNMISFLQDKM